MADNEQITQSNVNNASKDGRANNGRKAGSMNKATAEMKVARKAFNERVYKNTDKLFNSQLDLAVGEKYLMVITTVGKGAKARRETTIVDNPDTIRRYLDGEIEDSEDEYYFMTTKPANNPAIDSMLNRAYGKPKESVDLTSKGERLTAAPLIISDIGETVTEDET